MNELVTLHPFTNPDFGTVNAVIVNGEVLYKATDVAKALKYRSPESAIKRFAKDIRKVRVSNKYGSSVTRFLTRLDVYFLADHAPSLDGDYFSWWIGSEIFAQMRDKIKKAECQEETPDATDTLDEQEIIKQEWESLSREWDSLTNALKALDRYLDYFERVYERNRPVSSDIIKLEFGLSDDDFIEMLQRIGFVRFNEAGDIIIDEGITQTNFLTTVEITDEEDHPRLLRLLSVEGQLYLNRHFFKEGIYPVIKTKTATADPNE